jgi:hypothetical protein
MTTITPQTPLDGMIYPFLASMGRKWSIETRPLDYAHAPNETQPPTLRYIKDNAVIDVYAENMNTDQFLAATGLRLDTTRGIFPLSKRIARVMRPYRFTLLAPAESITIERARDLDPQVWDGAALISRQLVQRMQIHAPADDTARHARELAECSRFELTILTPQGQDKGHAIVVEDLAVDLLLPANAAKRELSLVNGQTFVGLSPVHSADSMRIDIQSLINLHPFLTPSHMLAWLDMQGEHFINSIRTGELDELFNRLAHAQTSHKAYDRLLNWTLAEYMVSGGSVMWFQETARQLARQHSKQIENAIGSDATPGNYRYPIPGGRFYIMPDIIGRDVPPGGIELDPHHSAAWVNPQDYKDHIMQILGGCDADDALWTLPFTDHDRAPRVLCWRSPNQLGEYIILTPTARSHYPVFPTTAGNQNNPMLDARALPPRIDTVKYTYGALTHFAAPAPAKYSIDACEPAIAHALTNRAALGAYCNALLVLKAVNGRLPEHLPARLEDVIDGTVKDPRDMTPVMQWIKERARELAKTRAPIPASIAHRLISETPLTRAKNHWLDTLTNATRAHLDVYAAKVDELAAQTAPPAELADWQNWQTSANALRQTYANALTAGNGHRHASGQLATALSNMPNAREIILCALATPNANNALLFTPATFPHTLRALRQAGIIGEPIFTLAGHCQYWQTPRPQTTATPMTLNGVWFNLLKAQGNAYTSMSQTPKAARDKAKATVSKAAQAGKFNGLILATRETNGRITLHSMKTGALFAYVAKADDAKAATAESWKITNAIADTEGNLHATLIPAR